MTWELHIKLDFFKIIVVIDKLHSRDLHHHIIFAQWMFIITVARKWYPYQLGPAVSAVNTHAVVCQAKKIGTDNSIAVSLITKIIWTFDPLITQNLTNIKIRYFLLKALFSLRIIIFFWIHLIGLLKLTFKKRHFYHWLTDKINWKPNLLSDDLESSASKINVKMGTKFRRIC